MLVWKTTAERKAICTEGGRRAKALKEIESDVPPPRPSPPLNLAERRSGKLTLDRGVAF